MDWVNWVVSQLAAKCSVALNETLGEARQWLNEEKLALLFI